MIIPTYVPEGLKPQWQNLYASNLGKGADYAKVYANMWLKNNAVVVQPRTDLVALKFTVEDSQLVKQTENGEEYMSAILADVGITNTGHRFSEQVLMKFAEQINQTLPVGDIDHELMTELESKGYSNEQIAQLLKSKNGIVKAVKAIYEKGKLWVKLLIDKRYKKVVEKAKGLSLEAIATVQSDTKQIMDADLLGFTVAYNHSPANPRSVVVA
jgi:hypothetical protein